jgi:hypothetical protein
MNNIDAFLIVFAVGGVICGVTYFLAKDFLRRFWWCRAIFCILVAATIAPCPMLISGHWAAWPAVMLLPATLFGGVDILFGLLVGGLPLLLIGGVVFVIWSVIISRRRKI